MLHLGHRKKNFADERISAEEGKRSGSPKALFPYAKKDMIRRSDTTWKGIGMQDFRLKSG